MKEIDWQEVVKWYCSKLEEVDGEFIESIDTGHPDFKYKENWRLFKYCIASRKFTHIEREVDDVNYLRQLIENINSRLCNLIWYNEYWDVSNGSLSYEWQKKYENRMELLKAKVKVGINGIGHQEIADEKLKKILLEYYFNAVDEEGKENKKYLLKYLKDHILYAEGQYWICTFKKVDWDDMDDGEKLCWTIKNEAFINDRFQNVLFRPLSKEEQSVALDALREKELIRRSKSRLY